MAVRRLLGPAVFSLGSIACSGASGEKPSDHFPDVELPGEPADCTHSMTSYPGDCLPLDAPAPEEGIQVRYGPEDYDNPDEVAEFVISPGAEEVDCLYRVLGNDEPLYYNEYTVSSRPGMHHVILQAVAADAPDGFRDACSVRDSGGRLLAVLHGGIQGSTFDYPPSGEMAPENAGLATRIEPRQVVAYEMHAVNPMEQPLLRESWTNFWAIAEADVTSVAGQLAFNGGLRMNIQPNTEEIIKNSCVVPAGEPRRILDLFGHMHSHGQRFSAWAVRHDASGAETRTLIYESYDWSDLDLREFNSIVINEEPRYASGVPSGYSGVLMLNPGDRIDYECEIHNTETFPLVFALGAYTAEMCNLFGSFAPGTASGWGCLGD